MQLQSLVAQSCAGQAGKWDIPTDTKVALIQKATWMQNTVFFGRLWSFLLKGYLPEGIEPSHISELVFYR